MDRNIAFFNLQPFGISIERTLDPLLNHQPVAITSKRLDKPFVSSLSPEASSCGVRVGMAMGEAKGLCPELIALPPNGRLYRRVWGDICDLLYKNYPAVETVSLGGAFLDLTGTSLVFGKAVDLSRRIQQEIQDGFNLHPRLGVAQNKLVSQIAGRVIKPSSLLDIHHGYEKRFLEPHGVGVLPETDGRVVTELRDLNVNRIRDIASLTSGHMKMALGEFGSVLHQWSNGIDTRPVYSQGLAPVIREEANLREETNNEDVLEALLLYLVEKVCRSLRKPKTLAGKVRLTVYYADRRQTKRSIRLTPPTSTDLDMYPTLLSLLRKALNRRTKVSKLGVVLDNLIQGAAEQLTLFDLPGFWNNQALSSAVNKIRDRWGHEAIESGRAFQARRKI